MEISNIVSSRIFGGNIKHTLRNGGTLVVEASTAELVECAERNNLISHIITNDNVRKYVLKNSEVITTVKHQNEAVHKINTLRNLRFTTENVEKIAETYITTLNNDQRYRYVYTKMSNIVFAKIGAGEDVYGIEFLYNGHFTYIRCTYGIRGICTQMNKYYVNYTVKNT